MTPSEVWAALCDWYDSVGPEAAVVTLAAGAAGVLVGWLLLAAALQALSAISPLGSVRPLADLISPRSLQRLGRSLAGLSLTAGLSAPAASAGTLADDAAPVTAAVASHGAGPVEDPAATATMQLVEPPPPASAPAPVEAPLVVAPGDSFWSIAVEALEADGRPASDQEVDQLWRRLIDANRHRLADPDNPDLLYPGQELQLPS